MRIKSCRLCGNLPTETDVNLGILSNTGFFPRNSQDEVFSARLDLVRCEECDLVQLGEDIDTAKLFTSEHYGYSSSLNDSMVFHLEMLAREIKQCIRGTVNPKYLDIGSNDGTLLNHSLKIMPDLKAVGIDPTLPLWEENYDERITKIPNFFSSEIIKSFGINEFDIVTSISMFYDLKNPLEFAKEVSEILKIGGIWILEQSYLPIMLRKNSFDTICHEHLEYYNLTSLTYVLHHAGFSVNSIVFNDINGGSVRVIAQKSGKPEVAIRAELHRIIQSEVNSKREDFGLRMFMARVKNLRDEVKSKIDEVNREGKLVIGLGASTKGNTLLQYFDFSEKDLKYIEEINPRKHGRLTPGSHIPICLESLMKDQKVPDVKLVLPWHFKDNILKKQNSYLMNGGALFFPLPEFQQMSN